MFTLAHPARIISIAALLTLGAMFASSPIARAGEPDTSGVCDNTDSNYMTSVTPDSVGPGGYISFIDGGARTKTPGMTWGGGATEWGSFSAPAAIIRSSPKSGYYGIDIYGNIHSFGFTTSFKANVSDYTNNFGFKYGACGTSITLNPITSFAVTPSGEGLWVLDSQGHIYPLGDAQDYGQASKASNTSPAVSIVGTPSGQGYTVLFQNGVIWTYGDAQNFGNAAGDSPFVAMAATSDGGGYWVLGYDGTVSHYGNAPQLANLPSLYPSFDNPSLYTDMAALPAAQGLGYIATSENGTVTRIGGAPLTQSASVTANPEQPLALQLNATNSEPITNYTILNQPTNGTITNFNPATGSLTYTSSDPDWSGTTSFTWTAGTSLGTSTPATVNISVVDPCSGNLCLPPKAGRLKR